MYSFIASFLISAALAFIFVLIVAVLWSLQYKWLNFWFDKSDGKLWGFAVAVSIWFVPLCVLVYMANTSAGAAS